MIRRLFVCLGLCALLLPLNACYDPKARISFQAHFTLNGAPVVEAAVWVYPKDGNGPAPVPGVTDENGYVQLAAMAGEYHVCIEKGDKGPDMIMDPNLAKKRGLVPTATGAVVPGTGTKSPSANTDMMKKGNIGKGAGSGAPKGPPTAGKGAPPPPSKGAIQNGIPLIYKDPTTTPLTVTVPTRGTVEFEIKKE